MAEGNGDSGDWDVDAFLDGYKRRTATVIIYQRGDLVDEHARLESEIIRAAGAGEPDRAKGALEQLRAVEMDMGGSGRTFAVEACSHEDWYRLMAGHPPSDEERQADPEASWGVEFQVHAMALCVRHPTITVAQVRRMRTAMRPDDFGRLWMAVITCVLGQVEVPKSGLATVVAPLFERSSTPPAKPGPRPRSSSAANADRSPTTSTTRKAG